MKATKKRFHYIYQTTCAVTGKYYIGMHSTNYLYDGYMGSGLLLHRSMVKHGENNHQVLILEICAGRKAVIEREKELITKELLSDPMCLNIKLGGEGGWDDVPRSKPTADSLAKTARTRSQWSDRQKVELSQKLSKAFRGVRKSEQHRKSMSAERKGKSTPALKRARRRNLEKAQLARLMLPNP